MAWSRDPASFRDPSGFVFWLDGRAFRQVNKQGAANYDRLMESGLYGELAQSGLLLPHQEVGLRLDAAPPAHRVLLPEQLRFVSYPYEWCFSQLKAAALLTLEVQARAVACGMTLRDASAYNVQFIGTRPVFIDTLSFAPYEPGRPWVAYRQFCEQFLAPLALMAHVDTVIGRLLRARVGGWPVVSASEWLPSRTWLRPGLAMHIHLHARSVRRAERLAVTVPVREQGETGTVSRRALLGMLDSLQGTVASLACKPRRSAWSHYYEQTNYSEAARTRKADIVSRYLSDVSARDGCNALVWDLGANTGILSQLAADTGADVVALEADHTAVEQHYAACASRGERRILPLVQDLTNPSAAEGWNHEERSSLAERGPADMVMALALVHHLALGNNVPLSSLSAWLRRLSARAIVEFVPRSDSQVRQMLAGRDHGFEDYTQEQFEAAMRAQFRIAHCQALPESSRVMYLLDGR